MISLEVRSSLVKIRPKYAFDLVQDNAALCRKREGSKAVEYHLSALPAEIRAAVLKRRNQIETSQGVDHLA